MRPVIGIVLGGVVATAGFLLPRVVAIDPTSSSSMPLPGPSPSGEAVFFPTLAREDGYPDWGTGGTLVEEEGCIFLRQEGGPVWLVIWPHGWSVERTVSGVLRILDDSGTPVVDVGDQVTLHGGGFSYEPEFLEELVGQPVPARCHVDDHFVTSGRLLSAQGGLEKP
jgi:hypothetical protein